MFRQLDAIIKGRVNIYIRSSVGICTDEINYHDLKSGVNQILK